jgi:transposase
MGRMTLMTGGDRRRQWSGEERARILAEIAEPGAVVAEVARRADVCIPTRAAVFPGLSDS